MQNRITELKARIDLVERDLALLKQELIIPTTNRMVIYNRNRLEREKTQEVTKLKAELESLQVAQVKKEQKKQAKKESKKK